MQDGFVTAPGSGFDAEAPPLVVFNGGNEGNASISPGDVNPNWYILGILVMALVTGAYTIIGGLKAVIVTDVLQSVLMLVRQINTGRHEVENQYTRAVVRDGNLKAQRIMADVFELRPSFEWRGLGHVPNSALQI